MRERVLIYTCPDCGAQYTHDESYAHATKDCPNRKQNVKTDSNKEAPDAL